MQIGGFNPSLNMAYMVGLRTFHASQKAAAQAMERLATGRRINRTSDDPAGAAAAENLARDAVDLNRRVKGAERSLAVLGTADGGLSVLSDLLTNLNSLAVSSANTGGLSDEERKGMQLEAESILQGIEFVLENTTFDGQQLLKDGFTIQLPDGSTMFAGLSLRSLGRMLWEPPAGQESAGGRGGDGPRGPSSPDGPEAPGDPGSNENPESGSDAGPREVSLEDLRTALNLFKGDRETAQKVVQSALAVVSSMRGTIGTHMKFDLGVRLRMTQAELEGVTSEYSRIVDADYAHEVSALVRAQILQQASIASLRSIFQAQKQGTAGLLGPITA